MTSATLDKPLIREYLFYREQIVCRRYRAVACVLRGSLAYREPLRYRYFLTETPITRAT